MDYFIVDEIKMRGIYEKGQIIEGVIERVDFPNKGIIRTEDGRQVIVKIRYRDRKCLLPSIKSAKERQRADF